MNGELPFRATLANVINNEQSCLRALENVEKRFGLRIRQDEDSNYFAFQSVEEAKNWCWTIALKYGDNAYMVGEESEELVKMFPLFRINSGLYHIVLYILENKLTFDAKEDKWNNLVEKPEAKTALDSILDRYELKH